MRVASPASEARASAVADLHGLSVPSGLSVAGEAAAVAALLAGLWASSLYSYLLFHSLVEGAFAAMALALFAMVWTLRVFGGGGYAMVVAVGLVCAAVLEVTHAFVYTGMTILPGSGAPEATQLWVAVRYLTAAVFLAAPFFVDRRPRPAVIMAVFGGITLLLWLSVMTWHIFPTCYVEGAGQTLFKKVSEYVIAAMFVAAAVLVRRHGVGLGRTARELIFWAMLASAAAELSFSLYIGVFSFFNMLGHLLVFMSVYLLYRGLVTSGLGRVYKTALTEATEAVRASEAKLEDIVEASPVGISIIDADGRLSFTNSAIGQILGVPVPELAGRRYSDALRGVAGPDGRSLTEDQLAFGIVRATGRPVYAIEESVSRPDGGRVALSVNAAPLHDATGHVAGVVTVIADVTERTEAEARLRALNDELERRVGERTARLEDANAELEAFAYSVSHDLRAPLRSIDGFSQILWEDYGAVLDEAGRDDLQRVRGAAQRMAALIDAMLALSRLGRHDLAPEQLDLSARAEAAVQRLREQDPEREVTVEIAQGLTVCADAQLTDALLDNLLGNAWKFTSAAAVAHIAVGVRASDGVSAFYVRDDGIGFDAADADELFIPFRRLDTAEGFPGSGIGLATVRRIVARHGGRVWAESGAGEGATFWFTFGEPAPAG